MELTYNDTIRVELGERVGVYWLRLYESPTNALSVIADVPGNPGTSPTNAVSRIAQYILEQHPQGSRAVRWFICYPAGRLGPTTVYSEATFTGDRAIGWPDREVTRDTIEAITQTPLAQLPPHDVTLERVLANGGSLEPPGDRIQWDLVPRDSLPPPADPFRCVLRTQYLDFIEAGLAADPTQSRRAVAERFYTHISTADLQRCPRHSGDWDLVARAAVWVVGRLGPDADLATIRDELDTLGLAATERAWAESIFSDPMWWDETEYGNGQHRGCALRLTDSDRVVMAQFVPSTDPPSTWLMIDDA